MWGFTVLALLTAPVQTRVAMAAAESLHVVVTGQGPAAVMVPGLFGSGFAFRALAPALTAMGYRAIVIEPLGVGRSSRPVRADYSLTAQANRLAAVLDTLAVADALIISHAIGTSLALRLAIARPDLVAGIVSLEGGAAEAATTPSFRRAMELAPFIRIGGMGLVRRQTRRHMLAASGDRSWVTDQIVRDYTDGQAADLGAALRAYLRMAESREPAPLAPRLGEVRCPFVLLTGTAPHASGVPDAERRLLERSLPQFSADTVTGAGHFLLEERPDLVIEAVRAFGALLRTLARSAP